MKCHEKRRFETEHDARVELVGAVIARNRGKGKRKECRVYSCDRCGGFHLTSLARWEEPVWSQPS